MKLTTLIISIMSIVYCKASLAQHKRFITEGVIEYEKSVNMYAVIKRCLDGSGIEQKAYENYRATQPQFQKSFSVLKFTKNKTQFNPVEITGNSVTYFDYLPQVTQNNIFYTDLVKDSVISQKKLNKETYLIKDSIRKIRWKLTDEVRDIAGYSCRRVNAIILDSIYVVAFYTDEIAVKGGPESFSGLPGMIMGVVIPHENITWFAKKVSDVPAQSFLLKPPVQGKQMDNDHFKSEVISTIKKMKADGRITLFPFLL